MPDEDTRKKVIARLRHLEQLEDELQTALANCPAAVLANFVRRDLLAASNSKSKCARSVVLLPKQYVRVC